MVDEHIIIHNRKVDYILLMVAIVLGMINLIVTNSFSNFTMLIRLFDEKNFTADSVLLMSYFNSAINIFFLIFSIASTILMYISLKNILIDNSFLLVIFVLRLVILTISVLQLNGVFYTLIYYVNVLVELMNICIVVFILLLLIKNKILSGLTLSIVIVIGIGNFLNLIGSALYSVYFNNGDINFVVAKFVTMINYISLLSKQLLIVGGILTVIYLVKCICKNNIFKKPVFNTLIPLGSFIIPSTILSNIFCIIYFIIYYGSTR